jgi:hypothetical protein
MHGIIDNEENISQNSLIDFDKIAIRYKQWILSPPFDIGQTTKNGLKCLEYNP